MKPLALPDSFLRRPIAHRALHDRDAGRPENSREAVRAAVERGYGIEIDLQLSRDGEAMVFHDYDLRRLTGKNGPLAQETAASLASYTLLTGESGIPSLREVLALVNGRVPLLIEIKDQDGMMGENTGALEVATARALTNYAGDVALMSFNPHAVAACGRLMPTRPRGLTTCAYSSADWPLLPDALRRKLAQIPDFERVGASFVSHDRKDLDAARVRDLKSCNTPILCWTIRTPEQEAEARKIAENVTFEGYLPA
ncbi:Glycerophosphoryl diester phosphodiesterase [Aquimixticola soesokkakensis]|uniref:Glycerophosphoryl diester phosphodiesterase n=1 Tax=Aquimixticola soesokkakensis TaxID=1519096 RepID=A0A1Y5RG23_9RHOB|nr:glycerophosphodiester phosphodiesterase family protein [Aquimixticola soesokkakensis]SLN16392.1 Glycerophosphoryl diester phosphodiesterase [Aquimixticola soesokkakensis]